MKKILITFIVAFSFGLIGCGNDSSDDYQMQIDKVEDDLADLEQQVESLITTIEELRSIIDGNITIASITETSAGSGLFRIVFSNGASLDVLNGGSTGTDSWFESIAVNDDYLEFTFKGETEVHKIPVVKDFVLTIDNASVEPIEFTVAGEQKEFAVTITGAKSAFIPTKPDGWRVQLSESQLTITAPVSTRTSTITADSDKDIVIMAISEGGYTAIAKIQVVFNPSSTPVATVTADAVTSYSELTFSVNLGASVTGWYYLCKPSSEAAPSAAELKALEKQTTTGTQSLKIESLAGSTEYKIYVLPVGDGGDGEIVTATATTAVAPVDYYEMGYTAGGVTYDKSNAVLIEAATEISSAGVYIIDTDELITVTSTSSTLSVENLVIIGRYEGKRANVKTIKAISFGTTTPGNGVVLKNLNIEGVDDNYTLNFSGTGNTFENWIMEDCKVNLSSNLSYFNNASSGIKNIVFKNNDFRMTIKVKGTEDYADDVQGRIMNFSKSNKSIFKDIEFTNNIVYSSNGYYIDANIISFDAANVTAEMDCNINVDDNTFVNFVGASLINIPTPKSLTFNRNISWAGSDKDAVSYIFKFLVSTSAPSAGFTVENNIVYGLTKAWNYYHTTSVYIGSETQFTKAETDPFAGGTFDVANGVFTPAVAGAGATR